MASRRQAPPKPERPKHSAEEKLHDIRMIEQRIRELEEFNPRQVTGGFSDPKIAVIQTAISETLADVFGNETDDYQRYERATQLDHGPIQMSVGRFGGNEDRRKYLEEGKQSAIAILNQAIRRLKEEMEREKAVSGSQLALSRGQPVIPGEASRRIFIVHGHDPEMREAVARFIEKIGYEPVILHEQANGGRTVIEKFEAHSENAGFAVVLLAGDDEGRVKGSDAWALRARQNVLLELGYFVGKLSRARVCALKRGDLELPSDIVGVVFEPYDDSNGWKQVIARELEAAGYEINWNTIMRP